MVSDIPAGDGENGNLFNSVWHDNICTGQSSSYKPCLSMPVFYYSPQLNVCDNVTLIAWKIFSLSLEDKILSDSTTYVGGCLDRTQDCCLFCIDPRTFNWYTLWQLLKGTVAWDGFLA